MNASSPLPLVGPVGAGLPTVLGQAQANPEGAFADVLSAALSGSILSPFGPVPTPNPVAQGLVTLAPSLSRGTAVNDLNVIVDRTLADPADLAPGSDLEAVGDLLEPSAPHLNLLSGHVLPDLQTVAPGNAENIAASLAIKPVPGTGIVANPTTTSSASVPQLNEAMQPSSGVPPWITGIDARSGITLGTTSSLTAPVLPASMAPRSEIQASATSSRAIPAVAAQVLEPNDLAKVSQPLPQLRQPLPGRADRPSLENVAGVLTTLPSNVEAPADLSKAVASHDVRPPADQGRRQPVLQPSSALQATEQTERLVSNAAHLAEVRANATILQNNENMLSSTKHPVIASAQGALAADVIGIDAQPSVEPLEAFGSEVGRLDPVSGTSPKPPVQPAQPANTQIALHIARAVPHGIDRLSVQLHPVELGAVEIQLDFAEDGRVSALITAERPETLDMLQRDSRTLERSLNDTGLQLENGGLSFSLKQEQNQQGQGFNALSQQQSRAYGGGRGLDEDEDNPPEQEPVRVSQQRLLDIRT